jgi:hypothetical protein
MNTVCCPFSRIILDYLFFAQKVVSCFKLLLSCLHHDYSKFMIHDLINGMLTESVAHWKPVKVITDNVIIWLYSGRRLKKPRIMLSFGHTVGAA